jgi:hypothetical protein
VKFTPCAEYAFRHPLIRAVAYGSQLKSDRAQLHRRLAAAIEARASVDENAALIAEPPATMIGYYCKPEATAARYAETLRSQGAIYQARWSPANGTEPTCCPIHSVSWASRPERGARRACRRQRAP